MDVVSMRVQLAESAFTRAPIFDNILSQLSPAGLIRLGRCSRTTLGAVANFANRAFNINKHLSRFFPDPVAFRSLQARTATLISGSSALQFFDRTFYPESDLDLYTFSEHGEEIGRWLQKRGYAFIANSFQDDDFGVALNQPIRDGLDQGGEALKDLDLNHWQHYKIIGVNGIYCFEKVSQGGTEPPLRVQIITASSTPLECVLNFHCTVVMNVIAYDAAYSFYPVSTFEERRALTSGIIARRQAIALGKYSTRGWRIQASLNPFEQRDGPPPFYLNTVRWVGDRQTWTMALDTTGIELPSPISVSSESFTWDPVAHNSWILTSNPSDRTCGTSYHIAKSTVLRYRYLVAEQPLLEQLIEFFITQGTLEFLKVPAHERIPSEGWRQRCTWWDAEIPRFCALYRASIENS
ncbi:hypothetical protein JAAARDRAFT_211257 [Jaapia argillacea MUCL 33604]|uniref:Uncharacterized protein n=1 Tax=Jaapia argillacea MUCL 33604 TaxID=933084 RepID=A0A067P876_9AGAM|nr:hypothetical protein JAAARDRAFT_211257 [Jaapia argillacea MUCL 33604]